MNRNNGTLPTKARRGGVPHPDRTATVVKTLRAAFLQPRYRLLVTVFTLSEAQKRANRLFSYFPSLRKEQTDCFYTFRGSDGSKSTEFIPSYPYDRKKSTEIIPSYPSERSKQI